MDEVARMLDLARSLEPEDQDARYCFTLVLRALELRMFAPGELALIVESLARGQGRGFEELQIERSWNDGQRLEVSLLGEKVECPREPLVRALERLRDAWLEKPR